MKAAVYYSNGGPEMFSYEEVPDPHYGKNQILIAIEAISIEGGDLIDREIGALTTVPFIVGYQCAGTVIEVGSAVTRRAIGDRVVAVLPWGSHAEMAAADPEDTWVLPSGMDIFQAASIPVAWGTAHECLFEFGCLTEGQTVMIHGATGALGFAALQLAKQAGAVVIGSASNAEKLRRLGEFGLDHAVNNRFQDVPSRVLEITDGNGVDLVVDSVGGPTLQGSIECLNYRGRVVTVGMSGRDNRRPDPVSLWKGNKSMQGVFFPDCLANERKRVHQHVGRAMEDIAIGDLSVVIDRVFPLREVRAAHERALSREGFGRVMMRP